MRLRLTIEGAVFAAECDPDRAPRTLAALRRSLPQCLPLHTPKIAGSHLYWHAPFVEDVEAAADIMATPPGSFLYWPERQFLEVIFAPLQAETAAVTLLGIVEGDVAPLAAIGARVRQRQGRAVTFVELEPEEALAPGEFDLEERAPLPAALQKLRAARLTLTAACPEEITRLMAGRGLMHPLGPLVFAESEARTLHEALWWLRRSTADRPDEQRFAAALLCRKAVSRIGGFCHLTEAAAAIETAADAFLDPATPTRLIYDETILLLGRLAAWLDQQIAWDPLNEALRRERGG